MALLLEKLIQIKIHQQFFHEVAGGRQPPQERVRELWAIVGRRGGKSRIAAAIAVYLACFVKHHLAHGETGYVLVLALSRDQASVTLNYALAFCRAVQYCNRRSTVSTRTRSAYAMDW
jgi:phage terminase large subunit-like protein